MQDNLQELAQDSQLCKVCLMSVCGLLIFVFNHYGLLKSWLYPLYQEKCIRKIVLRFVYKPTKPTWQKLSLDKRISIPIPNPSRLTTMEGWWTTERWNFVSIEAQVLQNVIFWFSLSVNAKLGSKNSRYMTKLHKTWLTVLLFPIG